MQTKAHPRLLRLALPLLAIAAATAPASAEEAVKQVQGPPVFLGAEFAVGRPQGEFAEYVGTSYGFDLHAGVQLASLLGIRVDIAHLIYGSDSWKAMNPSFPGVSFETNTTNAMTYLRIRTAADRALGPAAAVHQRVGGFHIPRHLHRTEGQQQGKKCNRDTNFKDFAFAYGAGAGLAIPLPGFKGATFSLAAFYSNT